MKFSGYILALPYESVGSSIFIQSEVALVRNILLLLLTFISLNSILGGTHAYRIP